MVVLSWPGAAAAQGASPPPAAQDAGPPPAAGAQCAPSCRSGYVCVQGRCVSACNPPCARGQQCTAQGECVAAHPKWAASGSKGVSMYADSNGDYSFNFLGVVFFGPVAALEFGRKAAFSVGVRIASGGGLSYVVWDSLRWAFGVRLDLRYYFGTDGNMRGFFFGPALDYLHIVQNGCGNSSSGYFECVTNSLVPEVGAGYRWAFDNYQVTVGGRIGYYIPTGWNDSLNPPKEGVYGEPFVDVGWYF